MLANSNVKEVKGVCGLKEFPNSVQSLIQKDLIIGKDIYLYEMNASISKFQPTVE